MKWFKESTLPLPARTGSERYVLYLLESSEKNFDTWVAMRLLTGSMLLLFGWLARSEALGNILAFVGAVHLAGIAKLWKDRVLARLIRREH